MLRSLVKTIYKYDRDHSSTTRQLLDTLKRDLREDVVCAFDIAAPLIEKHFELYSDCSSFLDFLFRLCDADQTFELCDARSKQDPTDGRAQQKLDALKKKCDALETERNRLLKLNEEHEAKLLPFKQEIDTLRSTHRDEIDRLKKEHDEAIGRCESKVRELERDGESLRRINDDLRDKHKEELKRQRKNLVDEKEDIERDCNTRMAALRRKNAETDSELETLRRQLSAEQLSKRTLEMNLNTSLVQRDHHLRSSEEINVTLQDDMDRMRRFYAHAFQYIKGYVFRLFQTFRPDPSLDHFASGLQYTFDYVSSIRNFNSGPRIFEHLDATLFLPAPGTLQRFATALSDPSVPHAAGTSASRQSIAMAPSTPQVISLPSPPSETSTPQAIPLPSPQPDTSSSASTMDVVQPVAVRDFSAFSFAPFLSNFDREQISAEIEKYSVVAMRYFQTRYKNPNDAESIVAAILVKVKLILSHLLNDMAEKIQTIDRLKSDRENEMKKIEFEITDILKLFNIQEADTLWNFKIKRKIGELKTIHSAIGTQLNYLRDHFNDPDIAHNNFGEKILDHLKKNNNVGFKDAPTIGIVGTPCVPPNNVEIRDDASDDASEKDTFARQWRKRDLAANVKLPRRRKNSKLNQYKEYIKDRKMEKEERLKKIREGDDKASTTAPPVRSKVDPTAVDTDSGEESSHVDSKRTRRKLEEQLLALRSDIDRLKVEKGDLKARVTEGRAEIDRLRAFHETLQLEGRELEKNIDILKGQRQILVIDPRIQVDKTDSFQKKVDEAPRDPGRPIETTPFQSTPTESHDALESEKRQCVEQLNALRQELSGIRNELEEKRQKLFLCTDALTQARNDVESLRRKLSDCEENLKAKREESSRRDVDLTRKEEDLKSKELRLSQLEERLERNQQDAIHYDKELTLKKSELSRVEEELKSKRETIDALDVQLEDKKGDLLSYADLLSNKILECDATSTEADAQIQQTDRFASQIRELESAVQELTVEKTELIEHRKRLSDQVTFLNQNITKIEKAIAASEQKRNDYLVEHERLTLENESLERRQIDLKETVEFFTSEHERLKLENESLEQQQKDLKEAILSSTAE
ncbi:hypothetical protein AVEN_143811-1, partial [Araneus ventricosus]